ncbi:MAG: zinc ABC transporter substrate-binding protein [Proteobacteria bacterium]|nr:zinc ABC transporter substrate-binding protein [Pseudomonadota bacterium]
MDNIKASLLSVLVYVSLALVPAGADEAKVRVVTSFTILEDLARELGGEHVSVVNLVPRNTDAHMYRPKPSDSVAIANADLVIFNGLGFEGWIGRLIENADKENKQLIASDGVSVIAQDQETDPHAWQSFHNIRIYVKNITARLITLMPQHAQDLTHRQNTYLQALNALEKNLHEQLANTPVDERIVVTSHDAFGYLGRDFHIQFLAPLGLSLDAEASAEDLASVIIQIRERNVTALFLENVNNPRLLESISAETDVAIGGHLYSDALSEIDGPAATYLAMMRHNIESLVAAFNKRQFNGQRYFL